MSEIELELLRNFRSDTPAPDAETERRIYALVTATRAGELGGRRSPQSRRRRTLVVRAGLVGAAAAAAAALVTIGSPGRGPATVGDAVAAVERAATVTAASADLSGTAVVRITHNGEAWAGKTIRWHGQDLSVSSDDPQRRGPAGAEFLLVDGKLYAIEDGEWVDIGRPESIDPGSGTTPGELLAAVREDVGGATLRRLTGGMTGLTADRLAGGSTVYRGRVAARLIARESGFKEGQAIRVFPFGYVAHDEAADPAAALNAAVTVGPEDIIREVAVTWGTKASAWTYTVAYSRLGQTPAPVAPANVRDLLGERFRALLRERSRSRQSE
jgi:hypothetical protein